MTVHTPARAVVGLCPSCGQVLVVTNNHETWPLVECTCEWRGGTTELAEHRYYRRGEAE